MAPLRYRRHYKNIVLLFLWREKNENAGPSWLVLFLASWLVALRKLSVASGFCSSPASALFGFAFLALGSLAFVVSRSNGCISILTSARSLREIQILSVAYRM